MSNYHFNIAFKQKCKAQSRAFLKLDNTRSSLTPQPSCGIESILVNRVCEGKSNQTKSIDQLFAQRNLQSGQGRQRSSFYYEDNSEVESVQAFFYFYKLLQAEKNNLARQEFNSLLRKKNDKIVSIIQQTHANKTQHTNGNSNKDEREEDESWKNNLLSSKQFGQQMESQPSMMSNLGSQMNSHVLISSTPQKDILQSGVQSPKGSVLNSKTPSMFHSPAASRGQTPKQAEKQQSGCFSSKQSDSSPATNVDSQINFSNKSSLFFTPKNTIKMCPSQRQYNSFNSSSCSSAKLVKSPKTTTTTTTTTTPTSKIFQDTENQLLNTRDSYFNTDKKDQPHNNYFASINSSKRDQKYNSGRILGIGGSSRLISKNSVTSNISQGSNSSQSLKQSFSQKQLKDNRSNNNNHTTPNIKSEASNNSDNAIEFENMQIQHLMNTFNNSDPNKERDSPKLKNSQEIKTSSLCASQEQNQQSTQLSPIHVNKLLPLQQSFSSEYETAAAVLESSQKIQVNNEQKITSNPLSVQPNPPPLPAHLPNFFSERNSAKSIFMKTIWQQIDLQSGIHTDEIKEEREGTESSARTPGGNTPKHNGYFSKEAQDNSPIAQQQGSLRNLSRPKPMHVLKPSFSLQVDSPCEDQLLPKPTPSIYKPQNFKKPSENIPIQRGKSALNIGKRSLNPLATMKSSDQFLDSHDVLSGSKGKAFFKTKKSIFMDIIFKNALSLDNVLTNKIDQSLIHRKHQLHNSNSLQVSDTPADNSSSENNSNPRINSIPQPKQQILRSSSIAEQLTPPLAPMQLKFSQSINQDSPIPVKQPYLVVQQLNKDNLIKKEDGDSEQAIINLRNDISKNMTKIDSLLSKKATLFVTDDTQKPKPLNLNASYSVNPSGRRCLTRAEVGRMYSVSKYFDIQKQVSLEYSEAKKNVFLNNHSPHHRIITKNTSFVDNFH